MERGVARTLGALWLAVIGGCGARTALEVAPDASADAPTLVCPPVSHTRTGSPCAPMHFEIETRRSCGITLVSEDVLLDGEAFQDAPEACHRVLAMNRCGDGHMVGWADRTTMQDVFSMLALSRYLGRDTARRIAVVGSSFCASDPFRDPAHPLTYIGRHLAAEHVGDPARLAMDWDVVIVCDPFYPLEEAELETLSRFVTELGGGVAITADYMTGAGLSTLTDPCGFRFDAVDVPWSSASATLDCVPDYF